MPNQTPAVVLGAKCALRSRLGFGSSQTGASVGVGVIVGVVVGVFVDVAVDVGVSVGVSVDVGVKVDVSVGVTTPGQRSSSDALIVSSKRAGLPFPGTDRYHSTRRLLA